MHSGERERGGSRCKSEIPEIVLQNNVVDGVKHKAHGRLVRRIRHLNVQTLPLRRPVETAELLFNVRQGSSLVAAALVLGKAYVQVNRLDFRSKQVTLRQGNTNVDGTRRPTKKRA